MMRIRSKSLHLSMQESTGLLISNIDIDIDTIDDTFEVSIDIDDTFMQKYRKQYRRYFLQLFLSILRYRYFLAELILNFKVITSLKVK
jgi:hypothetical protein